MMQIQDCVESWSHIQIVLPAMFLKRGPQESINQLVFSCAGVHNGVKKILGVFCFVSLFDWVKKKKVIYVIDVERVEFLFGIIGLLFNPIDTKYTLYI